MANIGTRKLKLRIGTTEYTASVSKCEIAAAEASSDYVTFADAAAGGARDYLLKLTMSQDAAAGSLWSQIWDSAGTDVTAVVMPYGNTTASASQPHFSGTVTIKEPDGTLVGGEADASSTAVQTVEVEWPYLAKPTKVVA